MQRTRPLTSPEDPDVVLQRNSILANFYQRQPGVAVAIWTFSPHHPGDLAQIHLSLYNEAYKNLSDVSTFGTGSISEVAIRTASFSSLARAQELTASRKRAVDIFIAIANRQILRDTAMLLHLSKLGRISSVYVEIIGVFSNNVLKELVIGEFVLPDTPPRTTDQRRHSICEERFLVPLPMGVLDYRRSSSEPVIVPVVSVPTVTNKEPLTTVWQPRKAYRWTDWSVDGAVTSYHGNPLAALKKTYRTASLDFRCSECGSSDTTQRRRNAEGALTLCNRCGLRCKRTRYAQKLKSSPPAVIMSSDEGIVLSLQ